MTKKKKKKKSNKIKQIQPNQFSTQSNQPENLEDRKLVIDEGALSNQVLDISLLNKIKKLEPITDKTLCIYVPITWPFTYTKFFENFLKIIHPSHMVKLRELGVVDYFTILEKRFPICRNRNEAVLKARKHSATHIMFLDADMSHPIDVIYKLMKYNTPISCGMYFHQSPPHLPVLYRHKYKLEYEHYYDYPRDRLFEVDLTGLGCLLADMRVFDDIEMPYFAYGSSREDGMVDISEDVEFCKKARVKNYSIVTDPTVQCTHYSVGDVSQYIFDVYMERYKSYKELLAKFGEEQVGGKLT